MTTETEGSECEGEQHSIGVIANESKEVLHGRP
jgi:hypothetical protein